jgi:hypothetical protein
MTSVTKPSRILLGRERRRSAGVDEATRRALLGFVVPLWIGAGFADWLCHRHSDIEHTAGKREAIIHLLMMGQAGGPSLLGLLCEVEADVLAVAYASLAAHQATAVWDVSYAESQREVTVTEQHIHGLLEQVPVMAAAFLTVLHWDQAQALFSKRRAKLRLRPKRNALRTRTLAGLLGAIATLGVAPYVEELQRCRRAESSSSDEPKARRQTHAAD